MSQQQTVRITTTETTNSSALIINSGYLSTIPGLLKVSQFILGCICVGIIAYHFNDRHISTTSELFYYLMCVTFLICTTILLVSCLISWSTGGIISKTIYELIYHCVAAILIIIASVALIVVINDRSVSHIYRPIYKELLAAGVIGLINGLLYVLSTFYARRSYKGI
ncbi:uncharacterized protein LOC129568455 [Sitodiplosis mosellana]|uniref:uncharacterized protein LOC129568455 n=1 Tax=Sitodiplosis mosellana TaxID=263140 RepID=UPI002445249A|nr:uncharacterized protein LOC129568455 [Sitodiplosis mosellana]